MADRCRSPVVLWISAGVLLLSLPLMSVAVALYIFRSDSRALWEQVRIGDTDASVREKLGKPYREYRRETAPHRYYVPGYRFREREITEAVLIYMGADLVLYVWINKEGRVEDKFIGVS